MEATLRCNTTGRTSLARVSTLFLCVMALVGAGSSGLRADPAAADASTPAETESALIDASPAIMEETASVPTATAGDELIAATVNGSAISIPKDPADGISVDTPDDPGIRIALPSARLADDGQAVAPGVVAFDNNNGSTTVPVVLSDGSLSINTLITGPAAPMTYRYTLTIPDGSHLEVTSDGGAQVTGADGQSIANFRPAWAKDANGASLATNFVVSGTTLTQIVNHRVDGAAYPVVADPWWRPDYISRVQWIRRSQGRTLSVYPTKFGRVTIFAARGSAWKEVKDKANSSLNHSMYLQFVCHADWAPPWRASWNLDTWRPDVGYWRTVRAQCNP